MRRSQIVQLRHRGNRAAQLAPSDQIRIGGIVRPHAARISSTGCASAFPSTQPDLRAAFVGRGGLTSVSAASASNRRFHVAVDGSAAERRRLKIQMDCPRLPRCSWVSGCSFVTAVSKFIPRSNMPGPVPVKPKIFREYRTGQRHLPTNFAGNNFATGGIFPKQDIVF